MSSNLKFGLIFCNFFEKNVTMNMKTFKKEVLNNLKKEIGEER